MKFVNEGWGCKRLHFEFNTDKRESVIMDLNIINWGTNFKTIEKTWECQSGILRL